MLKRYKSFIAASSFYLFSNLFEKGIVFLSIPIFTRLLSVEEYGILNTYLSWIPIFSLIMGLSLASSVRNAYYDYKENLEGFISSILFLSLIIFLSFLICSVIFGLIFLNDFYLALLISLIVHAYSQNVINTISTKYLMNLDYKKRSLLQILPSALTILLSVVWIINLTQEKYFGRVFAGVSITIVFGGYLLFKESFHGRIFVNKSMWKYALNYSTPLIFHGLAVNILSTFDRTILLYFKGANETGIYSLIYSFSMIGVVIITAFENVWIPWFNRKMKERDYSSINKNVKFYIYIIITFLLVILFVFPEVLTLIAPQKYWLQKEMIPLLIFSSFVMFLYSISVDAEYYFNGTKMIAINTIIASIANIGLNLIFIPLWGIIGAIITTLISYTISFGLHYKTVRKLYPEIFPIQIYIIPTVMMITFVLISYLLIDSFVLRILALILALLIMSIKLYYYKKG